MASTAPLRMVMVLALASACSSTSGLSDGGSQAGETRLPVERPWAASPAEARPSRVAP